jgi:serine/threonine protein kinase
VSISVLISGCRDGKVIVQNPYGDNFAVNIPKATEYLQNVREAEIEAKSLDRCVPRIIKTLRGDSEFSLAFYRTPMQTSIYHNETADISVNGHVHRNMGSYAREVGSLTSLQGGPGVPRRVGEISPRCFIVLTEPMENSWSLSYLLDTQRSLNESVVAGIAYRILKTVRFAHGLGILHNNISAENIIVSDKYEVQLVNWGASSSFIDPSTLSHISPPTDGERYWPSRRDDFIALMETLYFAQARKSIYTEFNSLPTLSPFRGMLNTVGQLRYSSRPPYEGTMNDFLWYHNTLTRTDSLPQRSRKPSEIFV